MFQTPIWKWILLLTVVLQLYPAPHATGQIYSGRQTNSDPFYFQIEDATSTNTAGLIGTVTQTNPPGMGYGRFKVEFSLATGTPIAVDTTIDFKLTLLASPRSSPTASVRVIIPAGKLRANQEILIPMPGPIENLSFTTEVNGTFISGLSTTRLYRSYSNTQTSVVVIATEDHIKQMRDGNDYVVFLNNQKSNSDVWHLRFQAVDNQQQNYYSVGSDQVTYRVADYTKVPANPLDWTTVSKVVLADSVLNRLTADQSECLRQYIRHHGTMLIFGEGSMNDIRAAFEKWFDNGATTPNRIWTSDTYRIHTAITTKIGLGEVGLISSAPLLKNIEPADLSVFPIDEAGYSPMLGRVSDQIHQSFWNWSLEQLGQPPVAAFSFLIAMFVGIASPGLLIYCLRSNRAALLLVILPIMALIGTLGLISYASIHDGFGTYSRVRSLTILDNDSGDGVCMSRQVLFSGLQPRDGIQFGLDSEAWLIQNVSDSGNSVSNGGQLEWTDSNQIFRGMVGSREQYQFSVLQPVKSMKPFDWVTLPPSGKLTEATASTASCAVRNTSGDVIDLLIVSSGEDACYYATDLQANKETQLNWLDSSAAVRMLVSQDRTQPLALPRGLTDDQPTSAIDLLLGTSTAYRNYVNNRVRTELFETATKHFFDKAYISQQKCFYAFVRNGQYVDRAIEDSEEQNSLHLIVGNWSATE